MDGPAREGGGAAYVQAAHGCAIWSQRGDGAEYDLVERVAAAADVAADEVCVAALEIPGRQHMPGKDALTKAGREALELVLHALHVAVALAGPVNRVRAMRVGPRGVASGGSAGRVGKRLLADEHEGPLGQAH